MSAGTTLDQELNAIRARLDALEAGTEPPVEPPGDDLIPVSEQQAVDRIRQGRMLQIVPRVGGWRVDYRQPDGTPVQSPIKPSIDGALASLEPLPEHLKVPVIGGSLARDEQQAIVDLSGLNRVGRSCSVRWEDNGTHADTTWANPSKKHWKGKKGLLVEPVGWLVSVW